MRAQRHASAARSSTESHLVCFGSRSRSIDVSYRFIAPTIYASLWKPSNHKELLSPRLFLMIGLTSAEGARSAKGCLALKYIDVRSLPLFVSQQLSIVRNKYYPYGSAFVRFIMLGYHQLFPCTFGFRLGRGNGSIIVRLSTFCKEKSTGPQLCA